MVVIKKLRKVNLLELFHGPTLAFKDIAMQAIGNMYEKILEKNNLKINVVVATSGDTGAAAISAIKDRKNMKRNNKQFEQRFLTNLLNLLLTYLLNY